MAEYIERDKALREIDHSLNIGEAYSKIAEMPAADVVEVVRCKDCKHYNTACCADGFGWCECMNLGVTDEHFCSHGKRRNNDATD